MASSQSVVLTIILGFVCYCFILFRRFLKRWRCLRKLPRPRDHPFFGHIFVVDNDPTVNHKIVSEWCEDFRKEGMICLWIGWIPYVMIYKAELIEPMLKSNKHITKSSMYHFLYPWLGRGLLTSNGKKWHCRRKMLTPTFHFKILKEFIEVFNEKAELLIGNLEEKADGKPFNIFFLLTACALDIICETAMGESINAQSDMDNEYVKAVLKISKLIMKRLRSPWMWPDLLFRMFPNGREHAKCLKVLHKMTTTVIEKHGEELKEQLRKQKAEGTVASEEPQTIGKRKRLAFLDLLLYIQNEDSSLTNDDIREEVDTFMFEGHDTTAAAANWATYLLGSNPDAQKRLHEELDSVFRDGIDDRPVTVDDLSELKYLDCVVKESLRLYPPVPVFGRTLEAGITIHGIEIPENTQAFVLPHALHRDERFFPDPEKFVPERFLPENSATRHPFAYLPFSAGPRNCIGQRFATFEEKVILIHVFRKFNVEAVQSVEDLKVQGQLILRPSTGIIVKLTKRK